MGGVPIAAGALASRATSVVVAGAAASLLAAVGVVVGVGVGVGVLGVGFLHATSSERASVASEPIWCVFIVLGARIAAQTAVGCLVLCEMSVREFLFAARGARTRFALCVITAAAVVPRALTGRDADRWLRDDIAVVRPLADRVAARARAGIAPGDIRTGSDHFDAEWALVANQMSATGLRAALRRHPDRREAWLPALREAGRRCVDERALAFARRSWGGSFDEQIDSDNGHAYAGYALLCALAWREVDPEGSRAHHPLMDRWTRALAARFDRAAHGMFETFPSVTFPADVASCVAALALADRVAHTSEHRARIERWSRVVRDRYRDRTHGMLCQTVDPRAGRCTSAARGSGTAIAAYFLTFADEALARTLHEDLSRARRSVLGFSAVREFVDDGAARGDIDSGPVVFGVSVAATGFAMGPAHAFKAREELQGYLRTADLFGAPRWGGGWVAGAALGDAILFAMLTAEVER